MMTIPVKIKRSGTASSTPSSLDHGELAINYADSTLFWKDSTNTIKSFVFQAYASATHASTHATGGSDALTPADIGAAPAANARLTGDVEVDLALTLDGDAAAFPADASAMVARTGSTGSAPFNSAGSLVYRTRVSSVAGRSSHIFYTGSPSVERLRINETGAAIFSGVITVSATSGSAGSYAPSLTFSGDANTGFGQVSGQSDTASIFTAGQERVRVKSTGAVRFVPLSADPASGEAGDVYYNSASSELRYHNGSAFIGAAPAASPAITGNATFEASSGVPVTITNTGSGNSFVVNDTSGDTTPFVVDASGNTGIGVTPEAPLHIKNSNFLSIICERTSSAPSGIEFRSSDGAVGYVYGLTAGGLRFFVNNGAGGTVSETIRISPLSRVGINNPSPESALDVNGVVTVAATSGSAGSYLPSLTFRGDANTGFGQVSGQSDTASVFTAGHERVRVDSSGRVGIGNTSMASFNPNFDDLVVGSGGAQSGVTLFSTTQGSLIFGDTATTGVDGYAGYVSYLHSANAMILGTVAAERVRIDSSGRVGVATNTPTATLDINSDTIRVRTARTPASATAAGNAGDICWDANFVYVCTATNTWRKAALTVDGTQTIANDSITYAKIQNVSATDRLLGRSSAGAGDIEEITCTAFGRSLLDDIDAAAARTTLAAAPAASPTFTGTASFGGPIVESRVAGGNTGTAKTIALTNGTLQDYTLTGNCTFTLPNASTGLSFTLMLRTGAGGFTATFTGANTIRWPGGVTPTATASASKLDIFTFVSDGGKWYGAYQQNYTD